jgi:hypothetical protein
MNFQINALLLSEAYECYSNFLTWH